LHEAIFGIRKIDEAVSPGPGRSVSAGPVPADVAAQVQRDTTPLEVALDAMLDRIQALTERA
jgi:hypothetical protein